MNAVAFIFLFACIFFMIVSMVILAKIALEKINEWLELGRVDIERENDRRRNEYIKHLRGAK